MIVFKKYTATVREYWDPDEGYIHYIDIPEEILEEMGWTEGTELDLKVQMTDHDNVLVISKRNET
jgi:hypothetical protein